MTFVVLPPAGWRHDVMERPMAMLNVTPQALEKALGQPLIYDEDDFVPVHIAVVGLDEGGGQISFERHEGSPKPGFVVSGIGTDGMSVDELRAIFGFPKKLWEPIEPVDQEPTPLQVALGRWYRAKQQGQRSKQQQNLALAAMNDAGMSMRDIGRLVGLSFTRVQQRIAETREE